MPDRTSLQNMTVGIFVDYESPLARKVAGAVWSGLSRLALDTGNTRISASWSGLTHDWSQTPEGEVWIFSVGQDRPDAIDEIPRRLEDSQAGPERRLYGVVVAIPERPNPLSGALLYQGVERLRESGVPVALVEPAVLGPSAGECDLYARKILGRLD